MKRKFLLVAGLLVLVSSCISACGSPEEEGSAAIRLHFQANDKLRAGVLEGIVDTVKVSVTFQGELLVEKSFEYKNLQGTVENIPAGAGRKFRAEALSGSDLVYAGEAENITIVKNQQATVDIVMTPAYTKDIYPPAPVQDLSASVNGNTITLTWTATGNDWLVGQAAAYDLRRSNSTIQEANFSQATQVTGVPTPKESGQQESFIITNLSAGTYHFALKVVDGNSNRSAISNEAIATVGSTDTTPPAKIEDLDVVPNSVTSNSVTLTWTAPGDDGNSGRATQYDVRYSTTEITENNFFSATRFSIGVPAPAEPGNVESVTITGLLPDTKYYFAVKTGDEVPNWSAISNVVSATTSAAPDTKPPAAINDLTVGTVTSDSVELTWTAPGDDGNVGTAAEYDIRYSTSEINDTNFSAATQFTINVPAPSAAGTTETVTVTGLSPSTTYYFAIKTRDEANNWSLISNVVSATTSAAPDTTPPAKIEDLDVVPNSVTSNSVTLTWTAPGDDGNVGTAAEYDIRYSTSEITSDTDFQNATPVTGEPNPKPAGSPESFTVTGLQPSTTYYFAIKTRDDANNWSDLSNVPNATTSAVPDTTPPAAINDLTVGAVTSDSVELTWTAPGDDGNVGTAAEYDIRYSTSEITSDTDFQNATPVTGEPNPKPAGSPESFTVTGLQPSTTYYFAIKTRDDANNWSDLSNVPNATTSAVPDTTPPAAINDLTVGAVTSDSVELTWTAPGDDGNVGTAAEYDIRYSTSEINDTNFSAATQFTINVPAPSAAGTTETVTVTGLSPSTTYYFAIKTRDEANNWSLISNVVSATTQP